MVDSRRDALLAWLDRRAEVAGLPLEPASGDASFRRYFRLRAGTQTFIAMDAPPPLEDCRPFIEIAGLLASLGLNVPRIVDADVGAGFVLMTDLGASQYLDVLHADESRADALYADAMRALHRLQSCDPSRVEALPAYDERLLHGELALFHDWLCERHLNVEWDSELEDGWRATADFLVSEALAQPRVLVHRDYHSRNLMVAAGDENPGILDFQDAVAGPLTYDLVSLLRDCYIRWPHARVRDWVGQFHERLEPSRRRDVSLDRFWRWFETMGVQRHLKAAGIFARLSHRDGKDGYLADVPRTLTYVVDAASRYPALEFLGEFVATRCLPQLEGAR